MSETEKLNDRSYTIRYVMMKIENVKTMQYAQIEQ